MKKILLNNFKVIRLLITCLFFFFSINTFSQNLALNPGFEDTIQCPPYFTFYFTNYVANWSVPNAASSDFLCLACPCPFNLVHCGTKPHTGKGCAGIVPYAMTVASPTVSYREYITDSLSQPLIAGVKYNVSFYLKLDSDSYKGLKEIQAYFTNSKYHYNNSGPIVVTPQIQNSLATAVQKTWHLVTGSFIATGGEQFITIGYFVSDANVKLVSVPTQGASNKYPYYFIDDVSVTKDIRLPISLTFFTATQQLSKVLLQWQTFAETNNNYFNVQRSSNGKDWENITTVKGSGNSSVAKAYKAFDTKPMNDINYYRIEQTDFNGSVSFSEVRQVAINDKLQTINIYPNPASNELHITVNNKVILKMYNAIGEQVLSSSLAKGNNNIAINKLPQGVYVAVIIADNITTITKVIKQ